jgi:hypothetical protein
MNTTNHHSRADSPLCLAHAYVDRCQMGIAVRMSEFSMAAFRRFASAYCGILQTR